MNVKCFEFNLLPTNTYVVWDDTLEAVLIDVGCMYESEKQTLARFIASEQLKVKHILCTHFHFDHVFGVPYFEQLCGLKCGAHPADAWWAEHNAEEVMTFGFRYPGEPATIGTPLADGDTVCFGHTTLQCLHTPGHSEGGMSFYEPEYGMVFVGDTLFASGGMGRTDLHGGDYAVLLSSIRNRLFALPDATLVYSGHGPSTTLRSERWYHNL